MWRLSHSMTGLGGLIAGVCVACVDTEPGTEEICVADGVVQGDGVEFLLIDIEVEDLCPSGFAAAESHAKWVADAWGGEPSPIKYWLFEAREHPCWACGSGALGCAGHGKLMTTRLPDRHELSHAARRERCQSPLLEEGWAVLYGGPLEDQLMDGTLREALQAIEDNQSLPGLHYALAAGFAAFIIETGGVAAFRKLCELPYDNATALDLALLDVLGLSLDEVQLELDEYALRWGSGELRRDQACEGTDVLLSPASWTLELGCMADGVEGKLGGLAWNQRLVELSEGGGYVFGFDGAEGQGLRVELRNCERDGPGSSDYRSGFVSSTGTMHVYDLVPGTYVVRVLLGSSVAAGPELSVEMSVAQWP